MQEARKFMASELVNAIKIILKNLEVNKEMILIPEKVFQCQFFYRPDLPERLEVDVRFPA